MSAAVPVFAPGGYRYIKAVFQYARDTHFSQWPVIGKFFTPPAQTPKE